MSSNELKQGIELIIQTSSYGCISDSLLSEITEKISCFVEDHFKNTRPPTTEQKDNRVEEALKLIHKEKSVLI
jgi:hypothetical protein